MSGDIALIEGAVFEAREQFVAVASDKSLSFEREASFAVQAIMANDFTLGVAKRNPQSVINAVANVAAIGLSLNPAKKQAYLVPRKGAICLDIGYIGLLDLAIESGSILWGQAELVCASDRFILNGVDKPPTHERNPFANADQRGDTVGAYVVVKTRDGDYLTTTMTIDELLSIRDRSEAWKARQSGPWKTDPGEMMKKTVIKRAYKLWPKTDRLSTAIHHLNTDGEEGLPPIDNSPLDGKAHLGLTPARAKVIRAAAKEALQKFNENDEWGAYEAVSWIDDNEERLALWRVLHPHSDLRALIKRSAEAERRKQAELDAKASAGAPT